MFGHLKAEDFVSLMEGAELSPKRRDHLDSCLRCRATSESLRSMHAEVASLETGIPEPDWEHFRSTVRDKLLSRSVQRETSMRRWTGWAIRPAFAWALSIVMAIGITAVTVIWKADSGAERNQVPTAVEHVVLEPVTETIDVGPEKSLFDDVVSLGEEQQEQLRQMLEAAQKGSSRQ